MTVKQVCEVLSVTRWCVRNPTRIRRDIMVKKLMHEGMHRLIRNDARQIWLNCEPKAIMQSIGA